MKIKFLSGLMAALIGPFAYGQATFRINEIESNQDGNDTMEFIELYDGGVGNSSLDGLILVFVNGSDDLVSFRPNFDLDGFTTDADGYFVVGNIPEADVNFNSASNNIENGADAVVLYMGAAADFGEDATPPPNDINLIDVVRYGNGQADDLELFNLYGGDQIDEDANGDFENESIQRNPDGDAAFVTAPPTPGASNDQDPIITLTIDPSTILESDGAEASFAQVELREVLDAAVTFTVVIDDNTEISGPTSFTIPAGDDFFEFPLNAVDDNDIDGPQIVTITVSAVGFQDGIATIAVGDDDIVLPEIVINEMQVKADGDDPQFVELYNNQNTAVDIAGWSVRVFESDTTGAFNDFGTELGSFVIPSASPVSLAPGEFYLAGDSVFEAIYGITPDLQVEPAFGSFDITMILFDTDGNAVHTVFSTDGDDTNQANNAGGIAVADITVGPDAGNSPAGFYLDQDGGDSASILEFSEFPSSVATPGTTNVDFLARLRIVSDLTFLLEDAGVGATSVTVTRINDSAGDLTVTLTSSDTSEVVFQSTTIVIPDGEDEGTALIDVLNDTDIDGVQTVILTASATGFITGTESVAVSDDDAILAELVINEMLIDTAPGLDTEFLEIFNAGATDVDLLGYSIEKWESDSDRDPGLDGASIFIGVDSPVIIPPGGYYLIANAAFVAAYPAITVDLEISNNSFENSSATYVLRDANQSVVHTVFATDGGDGDAANIDGTPIVPDAIGNDLGFALLPDGNNDNVVALNTGVPSTDATPGSTNGVAMDYEVEIESCTGSASEFTIVFTASGDSDIYVSTDLISFALANGGGGVASGTYTDTAPPGDKAFYLIQEAGTAAP